MCFLCDALNHPVCFPTSPTKGIAHSSLASPFLRLRGGCRRRSTAIPGVSAGCGVGAEVGSLLGPQGRRLRSDMLGLWELTGDGRNEGLCAPPCSLPGGAGPLRGQRHCWPAHPPAGRQRRPGGWAPWVRGGCECSADADNLLAGQIPGKPIQPALQLGSHHQGLNRDDREVSGVRS